MSYANRHRYFKKARLAWRDRHKDRTQTRASKHVTSALRLWSNWTSGAQRKHPDSCTVATQWVCVCVCLCVCVCCNVQCGPRWRAVQEGWCCFWIHGTDLDVEDFQMPLQKSFLSFSVQHKKRQTQCETQLSFLPVCVRACVHVNHKLDHPLLIPTFRAFKSSREKTWRKMEIFMFLSNTGPMYLDGEEEKNKKNKK